MPSATDRITTSIREKKNKTFMPNHPHTRHFRRRVDVGKNSGTHLKSDVKDPDKDSFSGASKNSLSESLSLCIFPYCGSKRSRTTEL